MKIEGPRPTGPSTSARRANSTAAPGFTPEAAPARTAAATQATAAASAPGLDALLALQGEEFDPHRRSRQVKRGADMLDALEELNRGVLEGRAPASLRTELEHLQSATAPTGEVDLDAVLLEIDTRVAVELAKLERAA